MSIVEPSVSMNNGLADRAGTSTLNHSQSRSPSPAKSVVQSSTPLTRIVSSKKEENTNDIILEYLQKDEKQGNPLDVDNKQFFESMLPLCRNFTNSQKLKFRMALMDCLKRVCESG